MTDIALFTISRFAELTRTTRDTLLHYDKIGLLSPAVRGENEYRYYTASQMEMLNLVRTLQELGLSLEEIKSLKDKRTPRSSGEVLRRQLVHIDDKIDEWIRARKLLSAIKKNIDSVLDINENEIAVQFRPAEAIVLGELNDYSRNRNYYDALLDFYADMQKKHPNMDLNYPVWGFFSEERIKRGDWKWPDRYYFYNPEGNDKKPAGLYATGHSRGQYGQNEDLYRRMLQYIEENGLEVRGGAYEEYPLNEVCVAEPDQYLIRVSIAVCEKNSKSKH